MQRLKAHAHLVRYLGYSLLTPAVVMEFCENGDLKQNLCAIRNEVIGCCCSFEARLMPATDHFSSESHPAQSGPFISFGCFLD